MKYGHHTSCMGSKTRSSLFVVHIRNLMRGSSEENKVLWKFEKDATEKETKSVINVNVAARAHKLKL